MLKMKKRPGIAAPGANRVVSFRHYDQWQRGARIFFCGELAVHVGAPIVAPFCRLSSHEDHNREVLPPSYHHHPRGVQREIALL